MRKSSAPRSLAGQRDHVAADRPQKLFCVNCVERPVPSHSVATVSRVRIDCASVRHPLSCAHVVLGRILGVICFPDFLLCSKGTWSTSLFRPTIWASISFVVPSGFPDPSNSTTLLCCSRVDSPAIFKQSSGRHTEWSPVWHLGSSEWWLCVFFLEPSRLQSIRNCRVPDVEFHAT